MAFGKDNHPGSISACPKFDCVETKRAADFDQLWASSDDSKDGGNPYALVLGRKKAGAPDQSEPIMTGYYTLDGQRCEEYNPFAAKSIMRARVNPAIKASQQASVGGSGIESIGSEIPVPSSLGALQNIRSQKVPNTIEEMRRCPILARAALEVACPKSGNDRFQDANGGVHCPYASSIRIHLKIEQVTQIAGQKPMKTIDTVVDDGLASTLSVRDLIKQGRGN